MLAYSNVLINNCQQNFKTEIFSTFSQFRMKIKIQVNKQDELLCKNASA